MAPTALRIPLLALILATLTALPSTAADWQGSEDLVDGVTQVRNPEAPIDASVRIQPTELWRRGGYDDDVLFGLISRVCVGDNGDVYALDSQLSEVQIYSADGDYLRSIGGRGEGPGEFANSGDMFYGLGGRIGVLQAFPGKIVQLDPDGTPLDNFRLPKPPEGGFQLVFYSSATADRLVLAGSEPSATGGPGVQTAYLRAYDSAGNQLAEFHREEVFTKFGGMQYQEETFVNFQRRWAAFDDGRVAVATSFGDYKIEVYAADGTLERVLRRDDYPDLARTSAEKKMFQQLYNGVTSWNPRSTFEVSPRHVAVSSMIARDDGELWVLSGRGMFANDDGVAMTYDSQGRFLRRVEIAAEIDPMQDAVYILGDKMFVVTDSLNSFLSVTNSADEDADSEDVEPSMLVCYRLEGL